MLRLQSLCTNEVILKEYKIIFKTADMAFSSAASGIVKMIVYCMSGTLRLFIQV